MAKRFTKVNKIFLFAVFACLLTVMAMAQSDLPAGWTREEHNAANTAAGVEYLSREEKQVIYYLNLVRINGPLFSRTFLATYLDTSRIKNDRYVKSLVKQLENLKSMQVLEPARDLYDQARFHAEDMGKAGKVGHVSSRGKDFKKRFSGFSGVYRSVGENCDYGRDKALDIVMSLLIDQGISDLGHRKNILNKDYRYVGVSVYPHRKYRVNCVMDFGGERISKK
jgi:uncharacterized protein YkwD